MQGCGDTMSAPIFELDLLAYRPEDGGILDCWMAGYADQWLYVTGYESWYRWTGTHWAKDDDLCIFRQFQSLLDQLNRAAITEMKNACVEAARAEDAESRARWEKEAATFRTYVAATKRTRARVASIEGMAQAQRACAVDQLDAGNVLNLRNGTLDLDTLELRPHSPTDHLTYCLDYDYDPAAECPRYEQFLQEVLVKGELDAAGQWVTDTELCMLFQELTGYSLTTDTKYEAMTWLSGEGGNGKSIAIAIIHRLLGPLCTSIDFQTLGTSGNYDLSDIPGRRVLFSTESERGGQVAEGYLKRIVSGERIKGRPIYGLPFEFDSVSKVWWAMNDRPLIRDTGNSIWRRLKLIPFNRTFTDQDKDPDLLPKLEQELSGILNFAIDGLRRLRQRGKLPTAAAVDRAIAEYRHETNAVAQWINERTVALPEPATLASALYADYTVWSRGNGREPYNSTNFGKELKRLQIGFRANCRHATDTKLGNRYALGLLAL